MSVTTAAPATTHPLAQLSAAEVVTAREVLAAAGLVHESTRFVYEGLEEPDKAALYSGDGSPDRRVRVLLHDVERDDTARVEARQRDGHGVVAVVHVGDGDGCAATVSASRPPDATRRPSTSPIIVSRGLPTTATAPP